MESCLGKNLQVLEKNKFKSLPYKSFVLRAVTLLETHENWSKYKEVCNSNKDGKENLH